MQSRRIIKQAASFRPYDWHSGVMREVPPPPPQPATAPVQTRQHDEEQLRQAVQRAYLEGEAAARAALTDSTNSAKNDLARAVSQIAQQRAAIYKEAQADLLRLSIAIARRILHREMLLSPDILQGIVTVVLEKLDRQEVHCVRVHPSMAEQLDQDLKKISQQRPILVTPDPALPAGSCIFETGRGNVDASIDSQLAEIERGLADRLQG